MHSINTYQFGEINKSNYFFLLKKFVRLIIIRADIVEPKLIDDSNFDAIVDKWVYIGNDRLY